MPPISLLTFKSNVFSQNGEDGINREIFKRIGTTTKACCEFGAWDGIHFSNCRSLILDGWSALMIEGDGDRFKELVRTYQGNASVACVNRFVDNAANSLVNICRESGVGDLDFLSIDIDGLDYEIFETLDLSPRVICVEVNAGHNPTALGPLARGVAARNVGQPLSIFVSIAKAKGYDLVCYSGNAFFVRSDANAGRLPVLTSEQAYAEFLRDLGDSEKEWLYLVSRGRVEPYHRYHNPLLSREGLSIGAMRAAMLDAKAMLRCAVRSLRHR